MGPDLNHDELLDMKAASRILPGHPSSAVVWRWCRKGILARDGRRIFLEHRRYGRKLFTTKTAMHDFAKAVADADAKELAPPPTTKSESKPYRDAVRRRADVDAATERLKNQGFF